MGYRSCFLSKNPFQKGCFHYSDTGHRPYLASSRSIAEKHTGAYILKQPVVPIRQQVFLFRIFHQLNPGMLYTFFENELYMERTFQFPGAKKLKLLL